MRYVISLLSKPNKGISHEGVQSRDSYISNREVLGDKTGSGVFLSHG